MRRRRSYLWRKRAGPGWLERHESELTELTRGHHAIIERPDQKLPLIEMFCDTRAEADALIAAFGGSIKVWRARSAAAAPRKPIRVGDRLSVVDTESAGDRSTLSRVLVIPAGLAFGTGDHATTAMCLRLLERVSRFMPNEWQLLDVGTGTGVLALAARCFGAARAVAIDDDPRAIRTAKENARRNDIGRVRFVRADALRPDVKGTFDVITANLFSGLIIAALPNWKKHLRIGGRLILSGILWDQLFEVTKALAARGLRLNEVKRRGKWIALLTTRPR